MAYPTGTAQPALSTVNFTKGQTIADRAIVPVGTGGAISFYNNSTATTQLVLAVTGYFTTTGTGSYYTPITAQRALDDANYIAAGAGQALLAGGRQGIPSLATLTTPTAAVLTVSALPVAYPPAEPGYLTVWPSGDRPATSDVNFTGTQAVTNLAVTQLNQAGDGGVLVAPSTQARMLIDVLGYFSLPAPSVTPAGVWLVPHSSTEEAYSEPEMFVPLADVTTIVGSRGGRTTMHSPLTARYGSGLTSRPVEADHSI